jgi:hypothetical protein
MHQRSATVALTRIFATTSIASAQHFWIDDNIDTVCTMPSFAHSGNVQIKRKLKAQNILIAGKSGQYSNELNELYLCCCCCVMDCCELQTWILGYAKNVERNGSQDILFFGNFRSDWLIWCSDNLYLRFWVKPANSVGRLYTFKVLQIIFFWEDCLSDWLIWCSDDFFRILGRACKLEWVEKGLFSKSHLYLWFSLNLIFYNWIM